MIRKRIFSLFIILSTLTFSACAQGPNSPMGYGGGRSIMGCGYGGGFMWLIVIVLVFGVIYALRQASKSKGSAGSITETSSDILEKRYAKGEITREEFDKMKADIKN
nr:SHOCT domain-containing protein [uncultured Desulfobacter sp.]